MHRSHNLINYNEEIASKEGDFLGTKCPCMYKSIHAEKIKTKSLPGERSPKLDSGFTPNQKGKD